MEIKNIQCMEDRKNLVKHEIISSEGEEIPLNSEHFEIPTQQCFNVIFVLMKFPDSYVHFLPSWTNHLSVYITLHS